MSKIIIGGNVFEVEGSLSMINGKWYDGAGREIDMNNLEDTRDTKTINITIEGDVERLEVDCCNSITVNGNVRKVNTGSGSITCKDIDGDAHTGSVSIHAENISGDAKTGSGSIRANSIGGKAKTGSGNVYENGVKQTKPSREGSVIVNQVFGSMFGSTNTVTYGSGEVISGGFSMTKDANGVKHMTLHRDCTINGRRIADMTKEELDAWIAEKAKQGKIITIL